MESTGKELTRENYYHECNWQLKLEGKKTKKKRRKFYCYKRKILTPSVWLPRK